MVDGRALSTNRVDPVWPHGEVGGFWERKPLDPSGTKPAPTEGVEDGEQTIPILRDFHYRIDELSGRIVVEIRDGVTGELIRQVPPEEMLRVARSIQAFLGLQIDRRV